MAFLAHSHDDGQAKPFEYLPAGAGLTLEPGTALKMAGGLLAIASGTDVPTYISETSAESTTEGQTVAVSRVDGARIYETELSEAAKALALGARHTIDATGGRITATATGGAAEIVSFEGKAAGDRVRVRF